MFSSRSIIVARHRAPPRVLVQTPDRPAIAHRRSTIKPSSAADGRQVICRTRATGVASR